MVVRASMHWEFSIPKTEETCSPAPSVAATFAHRGEEGGKAYDGAPDHWLYRREERTLRTGCSR